jgi:hypothetical protein
LDVNGLLGDYDGILAGCSGAYWILMGFTWIYDRGKKKPLGIIYWMVGD